MNEYLEGVLLFALLGLAVAVLISSGLLFFYFWDSKKLRNTFAAIFGSLLILAIVLSIYFSEGTIAEAIANAFSFIGSTALPTSPLIWFFISLAKFLAAPKDSEERDSRRTSVICSAITSVIVCGGALFMVWVLLQAVANM